MTARIKLLAWFYIVMCGACLVIGAVVCIGLLSSRDPSSVRALQTLGTPIVILSILYFLPGLAGGVGLLRGEKWGRFILIALSFLVILAIPVGTAIGGFGLWVLLGKEGKAIADSPAQQSSPRAASQPLIPKFEQSRLISLAIVMAGVGAAFVVAIGTGFRLTNTPGSPISNSLYVMSIGVLVLAIVIAVRAWQTDAWPSPLQPVDHGDYAGRHNGPRTNRNPAPDPVTERITRLNADPVRRVYAERLYRGEAWSDAQIEYQVDLEALATCVHLQPIEQDMRYSGIGVRLEVGSRVSSMCTIDPSALQARFDLPAFVRYSEPPQHGRGFEDPRPARITCDQCTSIIDTVHPLEATALTPRFPRTRDRFTGDAPVVTPDDFDRVNERIEQLARVIDAPGYMLPSMRYSDLSGRPHIEIANGMYIYAITDRGYEAERLRTLSIDELYYRVMRDVAGWMAAVAVSRLRPGAPLDQKKIVERQTALLEKLDPTWAARSAAEAAAS